MTAEHSGSHAVCLTGFPRVMKGGRVTQGEVMCSKRLTDTSGPTTIIIKNQILGPVCVAATYNGNVTNEVLKMMNNF